MDDEWLAALPSGSYVHAKALALPFEITFEPVIIQSGLANGDDARMLCQCHQIGDTGLLGFFIIRMDTD